MTVFDKRRSLLAFWCGCAVVTGGVLLHLPMYLMGTSNHYQLAGMPMDSGMLWGMAAIIFGIALTAYGLLPRKIPATLRVYEQLEPPENAPLTVRHWGVAALLALALIIDIMKPASLGFVTPGMRAEYAVGADVVAWLPLAALTGAVLGSFLWGALADWYGRRAAILLSSVMFIGTSICGAMPGLWWNVGMCLLMGAAAGGMLPVAYALLAEIMPTRHRGWSLVLIGGIGTVGGFFAASSLSALLQPEYSWRVMWFLNLPTGLLLILMSPLLPESVRFLQQMGRGAEARAMLARFGIAAAPASHAVSAPIPLSSAKPFFGVTWALTLVALAWGLINFGVLLWLPSTLVSEGQSVASASKLIAASTLIAAPTILLATWLYAAWSTKGALLVMIGVTAVGLLGLGLRHSGIGPFANPIVDIALLIVGSSGVISILMPYATENYPLRIRGRATGWVAGCSKLGGLIAQGLSVLGAVPPLAVAAATISLPVLIALLLVARFGRETRGHDLRELDLAVVN